MQRKHTIRILIATGAILLMPLFGNMFIAGWQWDIADFIAMGILLFGTGLALDVAARKIQHPLYRGLACMAIVLALFVIWAELAVGIF